MKDPNKAKTKRRSKAKTKRRSKAQNNLEHKPLIPDTRTPDSFYLKCGGVFPHKPNQ
jgi:hypothetical protein